MLLVYPLLVPFLTAGRVFQWQQMLKIALYLRSYHEYRWQPEGTGWETHLLHGKGGSSKVTLETA